MRFSLSRHSFFTQSLLLWNAGFKHRIFIFLQSRINRKDYEMLCGLVLDNRKNAVTG